MHIVKNDRSHIRSKGGSRTDSGRLDHVTDGESLYCLVLGGASRAVGASDGLDMATAVLVTSTAVSLVHVHVDMFR